MTVARAVHHCETVSPQPLAPQSQSLNFSVVFADVDLSPEIQIFQKITLEYLLILNNSIRKTPKS